MNLKDFAQEEMKLAGLYDKDADYGGMIPDAVMALVTAHSDQGHSGASSSLTLAIFNKVVNFKPLTQITKNDFIEVSEGVWQCKRNPSIFSVDAGDTWYDLDDPEKKNWPKKKDPLICEQNKTMKAHIYPENNICYRCGYKIDCEHDWEEKYAGVFNTPYDCCKKCNGIRKLF